MSTNDTEEVVTETSDAPVTEADIRNLKYPDGEVETSQKEEDETSEEETVDETEEEETVEDSDNTEVQEADETEEEESSEEETAFVKQFPNIKGDTPEEYAKNLEIAYNNSTTEALRLKKLTEATVNKQSDSPIGEVDETDTGVAKPTDPAQLWVNEQMDNAITQAYDKFKADYPQVLDPEQHDIFVDEVADFAQRALAKGQAPNPAKFYNQAAISLGWEKQSVPSEKEKLGMAVKQNAASTKVTSSGAKPGLKSKVTDQQIAVHRSMTGSTKSDAEIRKELEPHVT
jgi:hypothetical protein